MEAPIRKASKSPLVCDACGEEIESGQETYLMRKPEKDGEEHTVHEHCISRYGKHCGGAWEVIPASSPLVTLFL